jgi:hypothetical protein
MMRRETAAFSASHFAPAPRFSRLTLMSNSRFEYVIYIRTTPAKLWSGLIDPESTRQYWVETWQDCAWHVGAS